MQTEYGRILPGSGKYVLVAPHGVSEPETLGITDLISQELGCPAIINQNFHRGRCNFNNIADLSTNQLKEIFYTDLEILTAKQDSIVFYIHKMCDYKDIAIDLGLGVRWNKQQKEYQPPTQHPINHNNSGKRTANIRQAIQFRQYLHKILQEDNKGKTCIGRRYAGWNEHTANQYFANTRHQAIQVEICKSLTKNPKYISKILSKAITSCYPEYSLQSSAFSQHHHNS